jgi:transposase-like protein
MTGQDGRVTEQQPGWPKRRTFTKAYKARILAAFDALAEGSPERGALLRKERLYHSHIEHWRKQAEKGTLAVSAGKPKPDAESEELARLRAENKSSRPTPPDSPPATRNSPASWARPRPLWISREKHSRCFRTSQAARTPTRTEPGHRPVFPRPGAVGRHGPGVPDPRQIPGHVAPAP